MSFKVFDKTKIKEYEAEAKRRWGDTDAYKEYEHRTKGKEAAVDYDLMNIFVKFGAIKHQDPKCDEAQALVKELQEHITKHYYTCTNHILQNLGLMYVAGDSMTDNINAAGGIGTAEFAHKAIEIYCKQ